MRALALSLTLALVPLAACHVEISPLAEAARRGDLDAIESLLASGADPHAGTGVNGWPPLLHAIHKGQEAAALRLMRESTAPSPELDGALFMAAGYAQIGTVDALLARGADPRRSEDGRSCLSNAVRGAFDIDHRFAGCDKHTATVRALLAAAPDLALDGAEGEAAVRAAERHGCGEMLALLDRPSGE